jgi:hypothetical protein
MNQEQADAEAKRLWGPKATARPYKVEDGWYEIVLDIAEQIGWDVKKWGPTVKLLGFGRSYDEAIQGAKDGQYQPER